MIDALYIIDRPDWQHHAACKGQHELFWPRTPEDPHTRDRREVQALAICHTCPVMSECRAWARRYGEPGIWGGETPTQRATNLDRQGEPRT